MDVATVTTNRYKVFDLLVAAGGWPSLIGCDWLYELWTTIDSVLAESKVQLPHSMVFNNETGKFLGVERRFSSIQPSQQRACTVPHALEPKVEVVLKWLQ